MVNRFAQLRRGQGGFTLIELLVVVAIIALLATFAVPKLFDAINTAKKAPGQADIQTIAGALDRFYMDQNPGAYPTTDSTTEADMAKDIKEALSTQGYLKTTTTYHNGWQNGYMYVTDDDGTFYVFADAQKLDSTANLTVQCGTVTPEETVSPGIKNLSVTVTSELTAADVQQGCKLGTVPTIGGTFTELAPNADGTASYTVVTN